VIVAEKPGRQARRYHGRSRHDATNVLQAARAAIASGELATILPADAFPTHLPTR